MTTTRKLAGALVAPLSCSFVPLTLAQSYPDRPIRIIIPWPAGGITDVITRGVSLRLTEVFNQQIVIDNRPGAGSTLGAALAAKANADGYTLLMNDVASHCISATLYTRLSYDPVKDFEPIMMVAGSPMVLVVNSSYKVTTLQQLVELAKAKPRQLNYASSGNGSLTHLGAVRLQRITGIDLVHVPFKGSIPATSSVMAGETAIAFSTIPAAVPQAKAGRLVLLAVSFPKRSSQLPDVPTVAETVGEFDLGLYSGLWAPVGTPRAISERLHAEVTKAMEQPRVKEVLVANSAEPGRTTPAQFKSYLQKEVKAWGEVVRASAVKIE
jgi:tripartite-type tricarboxylate transporter receptor subunit TctC